MTTTCKVFSVGACAERNARFRRTMEDAHTSLVDFSGVEGQGFFGVLDGHGGSKAAQFCGEQLPVTFGELLENKKNLTVPEIFHEALVKQDELLKKNNILYAGCTVIVAFLEVKNLSEENQKVTLYTANCGDARAVLSRGSKAIRLSYDHKASDPYEQRRINAAGGFIMNDRVNGSLAVTRALGDLPMKEFVVAAPYTTETTVLKDDTLLILACDGVWDVMSDQEAVDLIKDETDPTEASSKIVQESLKRGSSDNISAMVVLFNATAATAS
eukprot:Lithocolla_globosa_v1_NODE_6224_length_1120_cov_10.210329.p1 type:complete len:271 gc:universal NODE_6224_length_1120_cov_10.210329:937-125(-)